MILGKTYYKDISFFKSWWYRRQLKKIFGDRLFKNLNLFRTSWPEQLFFYSPRLKRVPQFTGNRDLLSSFIEAKSLEEVCPTKAIKVTTKDVLIDERGCISCHLCVDIAPEGILEFTTTLDMVKESLEK